ncbi:MAG: hypothetical protein QOG53_1174 [Frankiales bacterium]|jgi:nucleoid-associated protein YgaU|nr:hypothetical protein [Frankiales bacterium]
MRRQLRGCAVAGASAAALIAAGSPPTLLLHPALLAGAASPDAAVSSLAVALAWLVVCWVAVATLLATVAQIPGALGLASARACDAITPIALRRALQATLGLAVVTIPAVAPVLAPAHADASKPGPGAALPSLDRPAGEAPPPVPLPAGAPTTHVNRPTVHVVRPGDCLWTIAARHLDKPTVDTVADSWPRWYAANRAVIGADPNVLHPGQRLIAPEELA